MTKNATADIRATLKSRLGLTTRDVSVVVTPSGSIRASIKNPDVRLSDVEAIANKHERIDRDGFGEILCGGNTFVFVGYSREAVAIIESRYSDDLTAAAAALKARGDRNLLMPIGSTGFLMGANGNGYGFSLWKDGHITESNDAIGLAVAMHSRLSA